MLETIKKLLLGNSRFLNKKITIYEGDYNRSLIDAYNRGFEDNAKMNLRAAKDAVNKITKYYRDLRVDFIPKIELPPAKEIHTGKKYLNPITQKIETEIVELKTIGYTFILEPIVPNLTTLKEPRGKKC